MDPSSGTTEISERDDEASERTGTDEQDPIEELRERMTALEDLVASAGGMLRTAGGREAV